MKKMIILSFVLCVMLCLTTCDMFGSKPPDVSIGDVILAGINFTGADFIAKVKIDNNYSFEIPYPGIDWELFLNDNFLFQFGIPLVSENIAANGSTIVDVPFNFKFLDAFNAITSLKGESAEYKIKMALKFDIPYVGEKVLNLEHDGIVSLLQLPELTVPTLSIVGEPNWLSVLASGVNVALSMNIKNPNSFELPSPNLNLDFKVNNVSVINTVPTINKLNPNSESPLSLNFNISSADLARAGINALFTGNSVSTDLTSSIDFNVPAFGASAFGLTDGKQTLNTPWIMPLR